MGNFRKVLRLKVEVLDSNLHGIIAGNINRFKIKY